MAGLTLLLAIPASLCASGPGWHRAAPDEERPAAVYAALASDSLEALYTAGRSWDAFYDAVDRRRDLWVRNWTRARVPADLADRAQQVGGWRILVITEPGCSDSANSIPYIARLVQQTAGLEMRLVDSTSGRPWLETHRSTDGRAATPTILVLDDRFDIRGCWVEQPVALQAIWLPIVARGTMAEEIGLKMTWYADDDGRETLREFVEVLEGAKSGHAVCAAHGNASR
jgi:hypothetical protein